ncbi:translation initiation factor IF-2 [Streptomyces agglomeratus]|uniref:Translation initiation factor IF-2 n=1 Tax=Streptomyces agglomeratus TaxID=285458 RepID=A0A1E5PGD0_9ACTN|nr:SpoIIE family protein phosphatase [Streptomyces agglomeratus]OEJ28434.1 translation initiation factor IF-2 [Streptomyces agglomeratus]OEJ37505.1 translation initiation factor IF-2 [Streptomyces agglomeratus]OEJ48111.1 translation initiation factor IF-2 [Streptomyces agglomeratus]OEJ50046.1 translation initiation factor IF-2 [Streptomyces agglomeratus]
MTDSLFRTLPSLRRAVRRLAREHRLPPEVRARLVLSVSDLAADEFRTGRPVELSVAPEPGGEAGAGRAAERDTGGAGGTSPDTETDPDTGSTALTVTLRFPHGSGPLVTAGLPLPATEPAGDAVTWRISAPAQRDRTGSGPLPNGSDGSRPDEPSPDGAGLSAEVRAVEEELRAALAQTDGLVAEHRRLKHELAETNAGVLALYVQLEERDEQLRKAHGQILQELEDALRPPPLTIDGLELAVHYAPADPNAPTGGDLYDWFPLPDGTLHITVVDALGHGVRSTRSALNVTHAVRTLALEGHPLKLILARTHEILMPLDPELMATVLLARLDPATGELQLANGSHPPALLVRSGSGDARFLELRGRGIGYPLPGSEEILRARIDPGDLLILYTDGLTESRRDPTEGEVRLIEATRRHASKPLGEIPAAIAADMHTVVLHPDDTLALAIRLTDRSPWARPTAENGT